MAFLIDASVFIALERAEAPPFDFLEKFGAQPALLATITASELLHGVHRAEGALRRGRREQFVEAILRGLPILPFDLDVARAHSRLWADVRRRGQTIGAHDLILAATALAHDLKLLTRDRRDFGKIEEVQILFW